MTTRDYDIVDFLKTYKVASTSTLQQFYFPSLSAAQKRLKILADEKGIHRCRDTFLNEYIYFIKKPKQFRHSLLVTDFYREFSKQHQVITFKIEKQFDYVRPDAIFGYISAGKKCLGVLEVEISNKGLDLDKYQRFYETYDYRRFFPTFPKIFVVSEKRSITTLPVEFISPRSFISIA